MHLMPKFHTLALEPTTIALWAHFRFISDTFQCLHGHTGTKRNFISASFRVYFASDIVSKYLTNARMPPLAWPQSKFSLGA